MIGTVVFRCLQAMFSVKIDTVLIIVTMKINMYYYELYHSAICV
jgi:hypothetical protein